MVNIDYRFSPIRKNIVILRPKMSRGAEMIRTIEKYKLGYRNIISLAIPIIIGQLGGIITGIADTLMVGWHSTEELAAQ